MTVTRRERGVTKKHRTKKLIEGKSGAGKEGMERRDEMERKKIGHI